MLILLKGSANIINISKIHDQENAQITSSYFARKQSRKPQI